MMDVVFAVAMAVLALDCAGLPNGDNVEDECGTCDNDPTNDCIQTLKQL